MSDLFKQIAQLIMCFVFIGSNISYASAQEIKQYTLNDGFKFEGYTKATSLGAIGIYFRSNKIWLVQVLYHPSRYGVAVEYKVPGWVRIEKFLEKDSNKVCLEYVYQHLIKRIGLKPNNGPLEKRIATAMDTKAVRQLLKINNTQVLWAYLHIVDFRIYDGTTGSFPLRMFKGTPHELELSTAYLKKVASVLNEQQQLAAREFFNATLLQREVFDKLPVGAFGPTWMGLSPISPKTWQLMRAQQNANYLFNKAAIRQHYLLILQNAM